MQSGSSDQVPRLPATAVPGPGAGSPAAPITTSGRGGAGSDLRTTGVPRPSVPQTLETTPEPVRGPRPNSGGSGPLRGRLVLLRRDGSDGETITMTGESSFDIGRSEGGRTFPDDVYMATRHARFILQGGGVRVRSLDQTNGVLIQIREPFELQSGDVFYMGRELLRFEMLPSEERDPPPVFEHGVRLFGTTPRESWGRLRQLTSTGTTRDLWHLCRSEVRIGREEGDIVFPDDEFMSRRHAVVTRHGNRVRIEDQHSSNGTYVRLRGDRELQASDVLRIGEVGQARQHALLVLGRQAETFVVDHGNHVVELVQALGNEMRHLDLVAFDEQLCGGVGDLRRRRRTTRVLLTGAAVTMTSSTGAVGMLSTRRWCVRASVAVAVNACIGTSCRRSRSSAEDWVATPRARKAAVRAMARMARATRVSSRVKPWARRSGGLMRPSGRASATALRRWPCRSGAPHPRGW